MITSSRKWLWMVISLLLCVVCLIVVILDLKQPQLEQFQCKVVGTGEEVSEYLTRYPMLYQSGASHLYDIAFSCKGMGIVLMNDADPFKNGLDIGTPAVITHRQYEFMPSLWRAYLYHQELAPPPKQETLEHNNS